MSESERELVRVRESEIEDASALFCCTTVKYYSVLSQNVRTQYFLSRNVKTQYFLSQKNTLSEEIILSEVRLRGSPAIIATLVPPHKPYYALYQLCISCPVLIEY